MSENKIIVALGGDRRLIEAARRFADDNTVLCYGWDNYTDIHPRIRRCGDIKEAVSEADVVLMGLPCSADGVTIAAPLCDHKIEISGLLEHLPKDAVICGGMIPQVITEAREKCIDYYKDEFLQISNAVPTAEGAIMIAMEETPFTVDGARCTVLGSGRITKALVPRLKGLNAEINVVARKKTDRAYWETQGIRVCGFEKLGKVLELSDIIFNTVPAMVIGKEEIDLLSDKSLIIDLASRPGGVDFEYAKQRGKRVIWALSLPGKVAPVTAGRIIYSSVFSLHYEKGVIL